MNLKRVFIAFVCAIFAAAATAATPGMYQKIYSGATVHDQDPADGGVVIASGARFSICAAGNPSLTYTDEDTGTSYTLSEQQTVGYRGMMMMTAGTTYTFVKNFDDNGYIYITTPEAVKNTIIESTNWQDVKYGSFTPTTTGYHTLFVYLGQGTGGIGPETTPFTTIPASILWNNVGLTEVTDANKDQWHRLVNDSTEGTYLYVSVGDNPKLTIPAKMGLVLESVKTNNVAITGTGNVYTVLPGAVVTINFTAASGYEITGGNPVVKTIAADTTLADADYPTVQAFGSGNARYSTDGGASWTYVANVDAAYDAIKDQSAAAIIEALADGPIMSGRNFYGAQCDITLRSPAGGSVHTLTHTGYSTGAGWVVEDGRIVTLSNVVIYAALGDIHAENGFIRTAENNPTTAEFHLGPGSRITASTTDQVDGAGTCIRFGGKVYFDGGVLSDWKCIGNKYLICPQNGCGSTFYLEINAGGIENCDTSNGCYSWGIADNHVFFKMTGGFIRNCRISRNDVPVGFISSKSGTAYVSGGVITNNYCGIGGMLGPCTDSGKIYVQVSGNPLIYDNYDQDGSQRNVYLKDNGCFTQTGNLTAGAKIGLYCGDASFAGQGNKFGTVAEDAFPGSYILNDRVADGDPAREGVRASETGASNLVWGNVEKKARWSIDGGTTWTSVGDVYDAFIAVAPQTSDAIIEALADGPFLRRRIGTLLSMSGAQCNITLRSNGDHQYTLTRIYMPTVSDKEWSVDNGKSLTLSNIAFSSPAENFDLVFVVNEGSSLYLKEGALITASAGATNAAIQVRGGSLYFQGGVIRGLTATRKAPVNMSGDASRIYLESGGVENCKCVGNDAKLGSAFNVSGTDQRPMDEPVFVMTGGFIRNNVAVHTGGGSGWFGAVTARTGRRIRITGGEITGNTGTTEYNCGVTAGQYGIVEISGNPVIYNNTDVNGTQKNVHLSATHFGDPSSLEQIGNLGVGAKVGVYADNYTAGTTFGKRNNQEMTGASRFINDRDSTLMGETYVLYLRWTSAKQVRYSIDDCATWTECPCLDEVYSLVKDQTHHAIIEMLSDGDLQLANMSYSDWQCDVTLRTKPGDPIRTITRNNIDQAHAWCVPSGTTLWVSNIVVNSGTRQAVKGVFRLDGTMHFSTGALLIPGAGNTHAGTGITVEHGTLYFDGGIIRGWTVDGQYASYAPVMLTAVRGVIGRVYFSDGIIEDCSSDGTWQSASAFSCNSLISEGVPADEPVFVMTGGIIRNNHTVGTYHATENQTILLRNGIMDIRGGVITNNTGAVDGFGAVYLNGGSKCRISGNPIISDNRNASGAQRNILAGSRQDLIIQDGNLTSGAKVGVYSDDYYSSGDVFGEATDGVTGSEYIFNDRDDSLTATREGTSLKWGSVSLIPVWILEVAFPEVKFTGLDVGTGIQASFTGVRNTTVTPAVTLTAGTHFTVTGVAATDIGTYNTTLTGVEAEGYTGTTNVQFKIVGDQVDATGGKLQVAVTAAWKTAQGIDGTTKTLESVGANGLKYWQDYVLGIDPAATIYATYAQNAATATVPIEFVNFNPAAMPANSNISVGYVLQSKTSVAGSWGPVVASPKTNDQGRVEFNIDTPASGALYHRLSFAFNDKIKAE